MPKAPNETDSDALAVRRPKPEDLDAELVKAQIAASRARTQERAKSSILMRVIADQAAAREAAAKRDRA